VGEFVVLEGEFFAGMEEGAGESGDDFAAASVGEGDQEALGEREGAKLGEFLGPKRGKSGVGISCGH
jgi:hypothetical protein